MAWDTQRGQTMAVSPARPECKMNCNSHSIWRIVSQKNCILTWLQQMSANSVGYICNVI